MDVSIRKTTIFKDAATLAALAIVVAGLSLTGYVPMLFPENAVAIVMTALATLCFIRIPDAGGSTQLYRAALYLCAGAILSVYGLKFIGYLRNPPMAWDFMAFYFDAHVARFGQSLYRSADYQDAAHRLDGQMEALGIVLGKDFHREVIDVGFKNPPFTAFLLYPMTFLPMGASHVAWRVAVAGTVVLLAALVARYLSRHLARSGDRLIWDYRALVLVILLSMRGTAATMAFGQTSALVALLLFLPIMVSRGRVAGIWAALGVIVKPVAAIVFLYLLLVRRWGAFLWAGGTLLVAAAASAAVFGVDDWIAYLQQDFVEQSPAWLFFQDNTTSLLAEMMRWNGIIGYPWETPGLMEKYYGISLFLLAAVSLLVFCYARSHPVLTGSLLTTVSLVIYPGTQVSYGVITIIPLTIILLELHRRLGVASIVGLVCVTIGLLNYMPVVAWALLIVVQIGLLLVPTERAGAETAGVFRTDGRRPNGATRRDAPADQTTPLR